MRKGIKIDTWEAYAIKIINKEVLTQDERKSLKNELNIMRMVNHPNIFFLLLGINLSFFNQLKFFFGLLFLLLLLLFYSH